MSPGLMQLGPRCGCYSPDVAVFFDGLAWCSFCARALLEDVPAITYMRLVGQPIPLPRGRRIGRSVLYRELPDGRVVKQYRLDYPYPTPLLIADHHFPKAVGE